MRITKKYNRYSEYLEDINDAAKNSSEDFISGCEASYHDSIKEAADQIASYETASLILLAGPSASGKTTSGLILIEKLKQKGIIGKIVSLDDFYRGKNSAPLLPNGKYDYESIEALNVPQIQSCLSELVSTGHSLFPVYSFTNGCPGDEKKLIELHEHEVLIVEGIHALNPIIYSNLPKEKILKMYVSVKHGIKSNSGQILSHLDVRMLRRLVRDFKYRSSEPERTFEMWEQVCVAEKINIYPFKRQADIIVNSIHMYEPCVIARPALELLTAITPESIFYTKALVLIGALRLFEEIEIKKVPENSLLREFLGDSAYY